MSSTKEVTRHFSEVLIKGLGCMKKSYQIHTDPNVTPDVSQLRNHPVAPTNQLKQAFDEMETDGVIEKVDQPTE